MARVGEALAAGARFRAAARNQLIHAQPRRAQRRCLSLEHDAGERRPEYRASMGLARSAILEGFLVGQADSLPHIELASGIRLTVPSLPSCTSRRDSEYIRSIPGQT